MTSRKYPENPFDRMVHVEVEDSSKGKYRFDHTYPYLDLSFRYRLNRVLSFVLQWFLCVPWSWLKWGIRIKGKENARGLKDEPLITIEVGAPIPPDPALGRNQDVDRMRVLAHTVMLKMAGIESNPWPPMT